MAIEAFIKFEGSQNPINGESRDSKLKGSDGWSNLQEFAFATSNKVNFGTGGAGVTDRAVFDDLTITKLVDTASPRLFASLCSGGRYDTVIIAVRNAGGPGEPAEPYLEYKFAMVLVTAIDTSVQRGDAAPAEVVKFAYGALQIAYRPLDAQGKPGAPVSQAWSRVLNKATLAVK